MIIKSVYIEKFGGIKDKRFDFTDGLNIISLPNEGGKSTLAEFIRVMLFGVNSLKFNQRKRYMPFLESVMSGEIVVDCLNTEYIIKRSFGNKKSDDKIDVYNNLNGAREDRLCVDNVGELLTMLSGDTFDNTCYIKQLSSGINEEKSAELQARLINLTQSGSEDYSYKKAVSILDSAERELTGTKGKINLVSAKINELSRLRAMKNDISVKIAEKERELSELKKAKVVSDQKLFEPLFYGFACLLVLMCFFIKPYFALSLAALFLVLGVKFTLDRRKNTATALDKAREMGYCESALQTLKTEYERIDVSEYDHYVKERERYEGAVSDLRYAKKCLAEAFEELQKDYVPRLNKTAFAVFEKITEGKYVDFWADDKYRIKVRDTVGNIISDEFLSLGTYDQIYFSLRMALVKLIAPESPVVLDDSFALYDDVRLKNALSYLKGVDNQVILLTCHTRENNIMAK